MPSMKYDAIFRELRREIEAGVYPKDLPSEQALTQRFACSRNTVRRAIELLSEAGYVQSVHGRGVFVLFQRPEQAEFLISGVESMKEAARRNNLTVATRVASFEERTVDGDLSARTGFPEGEEIYYLRRVRLLGDEALILDHNYFLKRIVRDLTPEIAAGSIYEYMEQTLGEKIVTTQRKYTVELALPEDRAYLDLGMYNSLAVVSGRTYNGGGEQFEYTQSRHRPDRFVFYGQVRRRKPEQWLEMVRSD